MVVDADHIYWNTYVDSSIGRANLDGTADPLFILATAGDGPARQLALDETGHIYWTHVEVSSYIGRAGLVEPADADGDGVGDACDDDDDNDGTPDVDDCAPLNPAVHPGAVDSCNGIDDGCDDAIDEDYAPVATDCGVGACASTGSTSCVSGSVVDSCTAGTPAGSDATCDGSDDDCDGAIDEDYIAVPTNCGVGACSASAVSSCSNGVESGTTCTPGTPATETCNGVDDDCDSSTDEGGVCVTGPPVNKDQCKNGGWKLFDFPKKFKNQGECIQFVNTGK